jgi:hypothetical protein
MAVYRALATGARGCGQLCGKAAAALSKDLRFVNTLLPSEKNSELIS